MKVEPSTWTIECPCTNKRLKTTGKTKELTDLEDFIERNEKFGTLYYRKRGPIFSDSWFSENKTNTEGRIFSSPIKVYMEVTGRCNLRCRHCYNEDFEGELGRKSIEKLVDELRSMKVIGVQLIGGEPFIHSDIDKVIRYIKNSGLKLEIVTNGVGIDSQLIEDVGYLIDGLFVSIDGTESIHDYLRNKIGSFKSAVQTLRKFSALGAYTGTVMTVNRLNYRDIEYVCKINFDNGGRRVTIKPMLPIGSGSCMKEFYIPKKQRYAIISIINKSRKQYGEVSPISFSFGEEGEYAFFGCPGGSFDITVSSTGNVFKCFYDKNPRKSLGNIHQHRFEEIWAHIRDLYSCDVDCSFSNRCGGFCQLSYQS